jgi:excisionase family DNA binding protein
VDTLRSIAEGPVREANAPMTKRVPLRATEAARRLGVTTKVLLRLIYDGEIRYEIVDGIAHVPADAVEEHRHRLASQ